MVFRPMRIKKLSQGRKKGRKQRPGDEVVYR
jgi:hypothetical protein